MLVWCVHDAFIERKKSRLLHFDNCLPMKSWCLFTTVHLLSICNIGVSLLTCDVNYWTLYKTWMRLGNWLNLIFYMHICHLRRTLKIIAFPIKICLREVVWLYSQWWKGVKNMGQHRIIKIIIWKFNMGWVKLNIK